MTKGSPSEEPKCKTGNKIATAVGAVSAIVAGLVGLGVNFWQQGEAHSPASWGDNRSAWYAAHDGFFQRDRATRVMSLVSDWSIAFDDRAELTEVLADAGVWQGIDGNDSWEGQGYEDIDGYAWYRKSFEWNGDSEGANYLVLGRVDDTDETYLNGVLIGRTGNPEDPAGTAWDCERAYLIPAGLLRSDSENEIAVRVYDSGGGGGLVSEDLGIYASSLPAPLVDLAGTWRIASAPDDSTRPPPAQADWRPVVAPGQWDVQGWRHFDGTAWYQTTFALPPVELPAEMEISLGRIDDRDEVYLNGQLIGKTWRNAEDQEQWRELRRYRFSSNVLKRGGEPNELWVKVNDVRQGGGIHAGPLGIMTAATADRYWQERETSKPALVAIWDWLLGRG